MVHHREQRQKNGQIVRILGWHVQDWVFAVVLSAYTCQIYLFALWWADFFFDTFPCPVSRLFLGGTTRVVEGLRREGSNKTANLTLLSSFLDFQWFENWKFSIKALYNWVSQSKNTHFKDFFFCWYLVVWELGSQTHSNRQNYILVFFHVSIEYEKIRFDCYEIILRNKPRSIESLFKTWYHSIYIQNLFCLTTWSHLTENLLSRTQQLEGAEQEFPGKNFREIGNFSASWLPEKLVKVPGNFDTY